MRKPIVYILVALGSVLMLTATASAEDEETPRQFISLEDMLLTGDAASPGISIVRGREEAVFDSHLRLYKSMLGEIQRDALDDALDN